MKQYRKYAFLLGMIGVHCLILCACVQGNRESEIQQEEPPQSTVNTAQENMPASTEETTLHSLPAAPQEETIDSSDISLFDSEEHSYGTEDSLGQDIQGNPTNPDMVLEKDVIPFEEGHVIITLINYDNSLLFTDENFALEYQNLQNGEWFPVKRVRTTELHECLIFYGYDEEGCEYSLFGLFFDDYAIDSAYTHYRVTKTIGGVELVQEFTITFEE